MIVKEIHGFLYPGFCAPFCPQWFNYKIRQKKPMTCLEINGLSHLNMKQKCFSFCQLFMSSHLILSPGVHGTPIYQQPA